MTPSVSRQDLTLPAHLRKIPLKTVVVFSKKFEDLKVTNWIDKGKREPSSRGIIHIEVGRSSVKLFKETFPLLFEEVEFITERVTPKYYQILIIPEIVKAYAYLENNEAHIEYKVSLFEPDHKMILQTSAHGSGYYETGGAESLAYILGSVGTGFIATGTFASTEYCKSFAKAESQAMSKLIEDIRSSSTLMAYANKVRRKAAKPPYLVVNAVLEAEDKHRVFEAGERFALNVCVENKGRGTAYGVKVEVNALSIEGLREDKFVGDMEPRSKKSIRFEIVIPYSLETGNYSFTIKAMDEWGKYCSQSLDLVVAIKALLPPQFRVKAEIDDDLIGHSAGNANGMIEKGETIEIHLAIENVGKGEAKEVLAAIRPKVKDIDLVRDKISLGNLPPGGKVEGVLAFAIPSDYRSDKIPLNVVIEEKTGLFTARTAREFLVYEPAKRKRQIGAEVAKGERLKVPPAEFTFETKRIKPSLEDIDEAPRRKIKHKDGYAIVIGIEKYRDLPQVEFAERDAQVIREYLINTMGFPEENIVTLLNERALKSDLEKYFESWIKNNTDKDSTLFIYYAGHGAPSLKDSKAYLVPYDGDPNYPEKTCYPLDSLYTSLNKLPSKEIIVVMDSCFSGAGGRSVIAKGTRPMYISVENPVLARGNTVVVTAANEKQIASLYPEARHGLFTYFFLKGLKGEADLDSDGWIELKELFDYIKPEVTKIAHRMNREQTPVILPPAETLGKMAELKLTKAK